jgi:hypothetical protein
MGLGRGELLVLLVGGVWVQLDKIPATSKTCIICRWDDESLNIVLEKER